MTQRTARNLFLLALALACLAGVLFLQGCATTEYQWVRIVPACESYSWTVVPRAELPAKCKPANMDRKWACTKMFPVCEVYSFVTEWQADRVISADGTLHEHEMKHVMGEWHK